MGIVAVPRPLIAVDTRPVDSTPWALWNAVERAAAAAALAILAPALLATAAVVWILSGRFPLVAHRRVGRGGRPFWMWKLRTMWNTPSFWRDEVPPPPKTGNDPRVRGGFARFLRRHSIDELPQLVHVVTGRMALVGPRPLTAMELDAHYRQGARVEVLRVRPGLTGLWQVLGRSRLGYAQRRRLDVFLVRHRRLRLWLWILRRTIPQVISGRNAW